MALCYDLHSHSICSDGVLSPTDLLQRAVTKGVDVLALTDHDVTSGIAEAAATAQSLGVCLIPGVEISVTWRKRLLHIVGLGIDPGDEQLLQGLAKLREVRQWRAMEMGRRFEKIGINGVYEGARVLANGDIISRTHFARYLVGNHQAHDVQDAFKRYLKHGKRCYVPCEWASLDEAVGWITRANGQAVIAHPARYELGHALLNSLLGEFKEMGGAGIEVVTSSHNQQDCLSMANHAKKYKLLASMGSDFHEPGNSWIELGRLPSLPEGCDPIWQEWCVNNEHKQSMVVH